MRTKLLVLACALAMWACTPKEDEGTSPDISLPELETGEPAAPSLPDGSGQPPPGHGGPNPGWGGARPPGWEHTTPPGHLGDPGSPVWKHPDAPRILSHSQSRTRAQPGDIVSLQIVATDPNGLALKYTWSAAQGYLTPLASPAGSEAEWTAPFINSQVTVTVHVENTLGLPAMHTFRVHADADLGTAVFVSPNGSDSNPGTTTSPYATVQQAINAAAAGGATHVVLGAGTYREAIRLPSHISLWGQYDPSTWDHTPADTSILASPSPVGVFVSDLVPASLGASSAGAMASCVQNSAASGTLQGLLIASSPAVRDQSSVAVLLNNVSGTFTVRNDLLQPGAGGPGTPGPYRWDVCGGAGGGASAAGGPGCAADTGAPGGEPGLGGGFWGEWGTAGADGRDGVDGSVPPNQALGQLSGNACGGAASFNWQALGGTNGSGGSGGGGGGGGAPGICCAPFPRCFFTAPGNGGQGGAGGRGGNGGAGAGGSLGLVILDSTGTVVARNNLIATSNGGEGGAGGSAHPASPGHAGGQGFFCFAGSGGNGGNGGQGGRGGGGSGGAGGMSVGILRHNAPSLDVGIPADTNVYNLAPAGAGGAGGWPAPGGMPGIRATTLVLP